MVEARIIDVDPGRSNTDEPSTRARISVFSTIRLQGCAIALMIEPLRSRSSIPPGEAAALRYSAGREPACVNVPLTGTNSQS